MAETTVMNKENLVCAIIQFPTISTENFSPIIIEEYPGKADRFLYIPFDMMDSLRYQGFTPYRSQLQYQENNPPWGETKTERDTAAHQYVFPNVQIEDHILTVLKEEKVVVPTMFQESLIVEDELEIVDVRVNSDLSSKEAAKFVYILREIFSEPETEEYTISFVASGVTLGQLFITRKKIVRTLKNLFDVSTTNVEVVQGFKFDNNKGVIYPTLYEEGTSPTYNLDDDDIEVINKVTEELNKLYKFNPYNVESFSLNINIGLNDFTISARLPKMTAETYRKITIEQDSRKRYGFVIYEKGADIFRDTGLSGIRVLDDSLESVKQFGEIKTITPSDLEGFSAFNLSGTKTMLPDLPDFLAKRATVLAPSTDFDASGDWTNSGINSISDSDGVVTIVPGTTSVASMSVYKDISSLGIVSGDKILIEVEIVDWVPVLRDAIPGDDDYASIALTNSSHAVSHLREVVGYPLTFPDNGVKYIAGVANEIGSGTYGKQFTVYEVTDDIDYIEIFFDSDSGETYPSTSEEIKFKNLTIKKLEQ